MQELTLDDFLAEANRSKDDGWFKTGDSAKFENGHAYILGRSSVDIIKSGKWLEIYSLKSIQVVSAFLNNLNKVATRFLLWKSREYYLSMKISLNVQSLVFPMKNGVSEFA